MKEWAFIASAVATGIAAGIVGGLLLLDLILMALFR